MAKEKKKPEGFRGKTTKLDEKETKCRRFSVRLKNLFQLKRKNR